ncbi:MAG: cytochrome P450 [Alphaproteobacteria bacterium]|nr:MAG: cytochrome P450 [Alphaproteobacteria bacterium]
MAAIERAEEEAAESEAPFPLIVAAIDSVAPQAALAGRLLEDGAGLIAQEDALSLVRLLWLASTATTERTIGHCLLRLVEDSGLLRRLAAEPTLVPAFVEEVLRLTPPENLIQRRAVADASIDGRAVRAGDLVQICLPAANRDPAHYDVPDELRLDRAAAANLSFGSGIHQCVGGPMTRRVVAAAVAAFVQRFGDLAPLRLAGEVKWVHAMVVCAPREFRIAR